MQKSVRAPSCHDNVHACALKFFFPYPLHNLDLRCNFLICGYRIFLSLRCIIYYPRTMYAYDLCIYFYFSFVSTLWRHFFASTLYPVLSPYVSTLDSILSTLVYMLDSIYSWFDLTLTTFPTGIDSHLQMSIIRRYYGFLRLYEILPLLKYKLLVPPPRMMHVTAQLNQMFLWNMFCITNVTKFKWWEMDSINIIF